MNSTHTVELRWIPADKGGRASLPHGPTCATIAHFEGETLSESFSVVIEFPEHTASREMTAHLRLLAPDNLPEIVCRLVPGVHLEVTEGRQPVATAEVLTPAAVAMSD